MDEYRIDIKIRNNLMLEKIQEKGYTSISDFSNKNNLSASNVGELVNMTSSPLCSNGDFRKTVQKIASILECLPENLFTEKQINAELKTNKRFLKVSEAEINFTLENLKNIKSIEDTIQEEQISCLLENRLQSLSPREREVLRLRFGLENGNYCTLEEVANKFDVTRERIRQIEAKALRKMRHPSRADQLRKYLNE